MNLRSSLIIVGILAASILNVFLISNEHVEKSIEIEVVGDYEDRFADLIYTVEEREDNLKNFGLDKASIKMTLKQMKRWDRYLDPFRARLKEASDSVLMTEIFCPRDVKMVRPRYAAARVLIKEQGGQRMVLDPKEDINLIEQDWTMSLSFDDIYDNIERTKEELPYSTVMVIAALLSEQEDSLIRREEPWGRILDNSWDWNAVAEAHPEVGSSLIQYFAMMHLLTEIANEEGGLCG